MDENENRDDEDFETEDITENLNKKKKINSSVKGKSKERSIVHILNDRFMGLLSQNPTWGQFSRSVGSGNRWGQVSNLPKHAKDTFTGDLTCPTNFKWVIESKAGYNAIDLNSVYGHIKQTKNTQLDEFIKQVSSDAEKCGKKPLIVWKKDYKPRIAIVRAEDLPLLKFDTCMFYRGWVMVSFDKLLAVFPDEFFFQL